MGEDADRAELIEGYIDAAPAGPFDAAASRLISLIVTNAYAR
jgi:hypothetical protein